MVSTRSTSNRSQPEPKQHPTITGRVAKKKKATRVKVKGNDFMAAMTAEDCEVETKLMRQISLGEIIYSNRFDPPWENYPRLSLMGLPGHLRDKIINLILPILHQSHQKASQVVSNDEENFPGQPFKCNYIHPILWTCRQLRYDYGNLFLTNNHFVWPIPLSWSSKKITRFTQHAASVGVPDFPLFMDLSTRVDEPGYKQYPHMPLVEGCRSELDRWMKEVFYGVETRVLVNDYPLRRDDGLIAHFLYQAQQYREQGKSWEQLKESLEEAWEAFLERRSLAEVNLGKDVNTMTALYKASNERLEAARASGLGLGEIS